MQQAEIAAALIEAAPSPWAIQAERLGMITSLIRDFTLGKDVADYRLAGSALGAAPQRPSARKGKGVAVVPMSGIALYGLDLQPFSFSTKLLAETVNHFAADDDIGTIVLDVNSPGGVITGVPEAADAVFAAAQKKRVIARIDPLCASAAYWIASQANEMSMIASGDVGSIGVFMLHIDVSRALEAEGVRPTFIVSEMSPFKVEGNAFEELSEEAEDFLQNEVDFVGIDFLSAVSRGRRIPISEVRAKFGGGRVLDARTARAVGMVDRVGTLDITRALSQPRSSAADRRVGTTDSGKTRPAAPMLSARRRRLKLEKLR